MIYKKNGKEAQRQTEIRTGRHQHT
jgi:hypothetical protein